MKIHKNLKKERNNNMLSTIERIPILVSGAGNMGSVLIQHCLANPKLQVNIFIRDPSKNKDLINQVEAKGGKVFTGDAEDVEILQEATKGIHTVINTLYPRGDEERFFNSQKLLIDAAVKNGVKRYYPTEYGFGNIPLTNEEKKYNPISAWHEAVQDYLKTQPIKSVIVRCGLWYLVFPFFFPEFSYYGDINQKINLIDMDDLSELIIGTLIRPDFSGSVFFSGPRVSIEEATKIYNKVKGASIEAKRLGSLEDLKMQVEEALKDDKRDLRAGLIPGLNYLLFSGLVYKETDDNKNFDSVEITPLEEFFRKN